MKQKLITLAVALAFALPSFGWGQKGHDVVAAIAQRHLTPTTQAAVDSILGGRSLVYWANWLDNASHTPEYAYTKTWHYQNIDAGTPYEQAPVNPNGNVVTALTEQIAALQSGALTPDEAALALKIVTHLVGDLHQPMHMGHATDLGGNTVTVIDFGRVNNLHALWDETMVDRAHAWSHDEWAAELDRPLATPAPSTEGTLADWGRGTYEIAAQIYEQTAPGQKISYDYLAQWTPVVEAQLLAGGLRLAAVLNGIFDPQ